MLVEMRPLAIPSHTVLFTEEVAETCSFYEKVTGQRWTRQGRARSHQCHFVHPTLRPYETPGRWLYFRAPDPDAVLATQPALVVEARASEDGTTFVFCRHPELGRVILDSASEGVVVVSLHTARPDAGRGAFEALLPEGMTSVESAYWSTYRDATATAPLWVPYFAVADLDQRLKKALGAGAVLHGVRRWLGNMAVLVDLWNNPFGLFDERSLTGEDELDLEGLSLKEAARSVEEVDRSNLTKLEAFRAKWLGGAKGRTDA